MLVPLRAVAAFAALLTQVQAIPKVARTGRYLYQEDGTRFYIKGLGYQPQGIDLFASERDAALTSTRFGSCNTRQSLRRTLHFYRPPC